MEMAYLQDDYKYEIALRETSYKLPKSSILQLLEYFKKINANLKTDELAFNYLKNNLERIARENPDLMPTTQIKYCEEIEKENYRAYISEGKLCFYRNGTNVPIDTETEFKKFFNESALCFESNSNIPDARKGKSLFSCFILDENGKLYITPYKPDTLHHTFTTYGKGVYLAGTILIKDGIINYLDNKSGHYRVSADKMKYFFESLEKIAYKGFEIKNLFSKIFTTRRNFSKSALDIYNCLERGINLTTHPDKNDTTTKKQIDETRGNVVCRYF